MLLSMTRKARGSMAELVRLPDCTLITIRCEPADLDTVILPAGLQFPRRANRFTESGATTVLWTGPDDWLVAIEENAEGVQTSLNEAFAGRHAAIVDVSGNRARFALSGPGARDMIGRACSLDFDAPHFEAGHCAGTLVARAQAYLLQRTSQPSYEIFIRRSYSQYLREWFDAAGCRVI